MGPGVGLHAEFGAEAGEGGRGKGLGLPVAPVVVGGDELGLKNAVADALTEKVGADVDVLAGVLEGGVFSLCQGAFVVDAESAQPSPSTTSCPC